MFLTAGHNHFCSEWYHYFGWLTSQIPINVSENQLNLSSRCPAPPPPWKKLYHMATNSCPTGWKHTDLRAFPTTISFSLFQKESKCKEKKIRYRYNGSSLAISKYFMCNYWKSSWRVNKVRITKTSQNFFSPVSIFKKLYPETSLTGRVSPLKVK